MNWKERLKKEGWTDQQIADLEKTAGTALPIFDKIVSEAVAQESTASAKLKDATERESKLNKFWNDEATPQINDAFSAKATAEARAAFYQKQVEEAKKNGFIAADAPGHDGGNGGGNGNGGNGNGNGGNRNGDGRFVANANPVPGSPAYMTMEQGVDGISEAAYLMTEHQRLFNEPLPDLRGLMSEAVETRSKARQVWENKYKVGDRRKQLADEADAKNRAKVREEVEKEVRTEFNNKYGNPDTRPMAPSRYPTYVRDEKTGAADKLAWTKTDRRERLRSRIMEQVQKESTVH